MNFISYTQQVGSTLIITVGGNYKTNKGHNGNIYGSSKEFSSIKEFLESCRKERHEEDEIQFDGSFKLKKFEGIKRVVITIHRRLPVDFNGHEKTLAYETRRRIPVGIKVENRIMAFKPFIGEEFTKTNTSKYSQENSTTA